MNIAPLWWLIPSVFLIAVLYSSVGHGGASGYLAVLSLLAVPKDQMVTTALILNVVVAGLGVLVFIRAGFISGRLTWPFLLASVPAAFLGGMTHVPARVYAGLLAGALCVAAWRLATELHRDRAMIVRPPSLAIALPVGGAIGWLSGVVGIGGGIFLGPLLVLSHWASPKQAAASAACFILANSAAGLVGRLVSRTAAMGLLWPFLIAAATGGLIGSRLGANHFSGITLKRLLAVVLVIAAVKLLAVG